MHLPFTKMHGLGNDFVIIDDWSDPKAPPSPLTSAAARQICDRRFGIGADQILWLKPPRDSSCHTRMEILNADGSTAEMCGNGIRAVALYVNQHSPEKRSDYRIETLAGVKVVTVRPDGEVTVDMGPPSLGSGFPREGEPLQIEGREYRFFEVSMGNPHAVFFVEDLAQVPVERLGPLIENHPRFPRRTNVEFVQVLGPDSIRIRVWERGAGITLACGTGACASAVASLATGKVKGMLQVHLPGGRLQIGWLGQWTGVASDAEKPVLMIGPAVEVFKGEFQLSILDKGLM